MKKKVGENLVAKSGVEISKKKKKKPFNVVVGDNGETILGIF